MGLDVQFLMANLDEMNATKSRKTIKPVPINKVGEYWEGEDRNTIVLVKLARHTSLAILDSEASVAITTKEMWENGEN